MDPVPMFRGLGGEIAYITRNLFVLRQDPHGTYFPCFNVDTVTDDLLKLECTMLPYMQLQRRNEPVTKIEIANGALGVQLILMKSPTLLCSFGTYPRREELIMLGGREGWRDMHCFLKAISCKELNQLSKMIDLKFGQGVLITVFTFLGIHPVLKSRGTKRKHK